MPPIRFLHAAGLDPDAALPRLPASPATVFETAPRQAVERIVSQAIDLHVDFLLVTVADRPGEDAGFQSSLAIQQEFARLRPHRIPAFLAVGSDAADWGEPASREESLAVVVLGESVAVRNPAGRTLATISCLDDRAASRPAHAFERRDSTAELAIYPCRSIADHEGEPIGGYRYLGYGCGPRRSMPLEAGLAHSPGDVQSLSTGDCGPHGATLVTIDEQGDVQTEFVPLAAVRYESLTIRAKPGELLEDLAVRMAERLADQKSEAGEQIWNVRWTVEAAGELFEQLADASQRAMFVGLLPDAVGSVPVVHRLAAVPHPSWPAFDEPFAAEFVVALLDQESELSDRSRRRSLFGPIADTTGRHRIDRLLDETDMTGVVHQARRLGMRIIAAADATDDG